MTQQTTKKTTLKPLGNRVLVQRLEQEQTLKGGDHPSRHCEEKTGNCKSDRYWIGNDNLRWQA